jgi:CheY-like chemotaxis protein
MTPVTCEGNVGALRMHGSMNLSSLLICADEPSVRVLKRVLDELSIEVELCNDAARGFLRLAQDHFDLVMLDCEVQPDVLTLLQESHASRLDDSTLGVAIVSGQESIRELFSLGVNFVLYKPVTYEGALSSLRAAQNALFRDKRHKARIAVHTHAVIDYAGVEQARATLVDLAEDGMAVNFGKKVPPSCKVYFQFQLPGQTASVRLSGQVVWQDWKMNLADAPRQQLESEMVEVEHSTRANADGGLVHSGGKKQDLRKSPTKQEANTSDRDAVARLRSEPSNRRGETRYACRLGAEVFQKGSSVRNFCHLSDLSAGGCYLEMPLAFAAGSAVEIVVRTHQMKLKLSGEVKSSHPGYGMGVLFHLNTRDERHGVQQLIDFVAAAAEASS